MKDDYQAPRVTRTRHELTRRTLNVVRVERLPLGMVRIVLGGDAFRGFTSLGFDDHVKLFFPQENEEPGVAPPMRDYTPRYFTVDPGELWVDFFLHGGGPATSWAAQASVGQTLLVAGPRGSSVIAPEDIALHLLIGDETALPAVGRRLEELPPSSHAVVVIEIESGGKPPALSSQAAVQFVWVLRDLSNGVPPHALVDTLRGLEFATNNSFAWVACESRTARAIRAYLREERGFDKRWIKAAGYWQQGATGTHDSILEEA